MIIEDWQKGEQSKTKVEERILQHQLWLESIKKELKDKTKEKNTEDEMGEIQGFV